jgi:two-component system, NtrC family, nitrogen regulation sensor histidine kinase NtrY
VTFRSKLFVNFMLALLLSVGLVTAGVTMATRRAFDELNRQHTDALVEQFQREYQRRGHEVLNRVQGIAEAEPTVRMAIDLSRPNADISVYVNDARGVAQSHQLDFLDFVGTDGSIISSAEWSARFGYKMEWVTQKEDWATRGSFLMKLDTQDGPAVALMAVAAVRVGDKDLYVVGGERLGKEFLASLVLPENMRALLYLNLDPAFQPANLIDSTGPVVEAERFEPIIERERAHPGPLTEKINWTFDAASAEIFHAIPKLGRQNELLAVLLIGNSQRTVVTLQRHILWLAIGVAAIGILFGLFLSWWAAARVTLPVRRLAAGAREVSDGNWNTRVPVRGNDEIGQLAQSFNRMTQELVDQRERLIQAERVAAWREVARRLAHELKNPLFPLQTTVENLQRASTQNSDQFDEVFRESTGILLAEIENLKAIVGRFSDFAKMPQPELGPVDLNDVVRNVVKLFEAQFCAVGRPPITPELHLGENLPMIQADTTLLHRAIENLILNAMDAMPAGGILMMRTTQNDGNVDFEISDTGVGLTREEADRIFTPYYTTKQHGTGLGLAIVQAIVADHSGRISVESEMGVGTAFHVELPIKPPHPQSAPVVVEDVHEKKVEV